MDFSISDMQICETGGIAWSWASKIYKLQDPSWKEIDRRLTLFAVR